MTLVKICGITNVGDAVAAVRLGASMLGFVFAESPRRAETSTVRSIRRIVGGDVKTVGVFTDESDEVLRLMDECGLDYAQLHGYQTEEFAARIGRERVIRAVRVKSRYFDRLRMTISEFQEASFYLLDTYKEGIAGGTGETFDWELAAQANEFGRPIILSGGLRPENVGQAIRQVRPFAVDVSSGVELEPGVKDHEKIEEFIANVKRADNHA
jgi:phosphoribosylanthranilate isomerase